MLTPNQIKQVREYWGLSAKAMSVVLGFGINTWRQYEHGSPPNKSNGLLVMACNDPYSFLNLLNYVPEHEIAQLGKPYKLAKAKAEDAVAEIYHMTDLYQAKISRNYVTEQFDPEATE